MLCNKCVYICMALSMAISNWSNEFLDTSRVAYSLGSRFTLLLLELSLSALMLIGLVVWLLDEPPPDTVFSRWQLGIVVLQIATHHFSLEHWSWVPCGGKRGRWSMLASAAANYIDPWRRLWLFSMTTSPPCTSLETLCNINVWNTLRLICILYENMLHWVISAFFTSRHRHSSQISSPKGCCHRSSLIFGPAWIFVLPTFSLQGSVRHMLVSCIHTIGQP